MQLRTSKKLLTLAIAGLLAAPAAVQATDVDNPYLKADDSWISISGTVDTVMPDRFVLDYGEGVITVEMDDWDNDADAYKVVKGDEVTVYGAIDDDLFETTTIEASSVYVDGLNTYFYASAADEEDAFVTITTPVVHASTVAQGTVTDVSDDQFTVDAGIKDFVVDVSTMSYDPLDDTGFQKIDVGDRVSVSGDMTEAFFDQRTLMAESVIELSHDDSDTS